MNSSTVTLAGRFVQHAAQAEGHMTSAQDVAEIIAGEVTRHDYMHQQKVHHTYVSRTAIDAQAKA